MMNYVLAWGAHAFTAAGLLLGFGALIAAFEQQLMWTFWLLAGTVLIDSFDGMLARWAEVKKYAKKIDGAMMDNIIDFLTYSLVPAAVVYQFELVPDDQKWWVIGGLLLASIYQFSQIDAKTEDHYFLGFPSYWNIVVMYMFIFNWSVAVNALVLYACVVLSFVPIKYAYPSRLDYAFSNPRWNNVLFGLTCGWGIAMLWGLMNDLEAGWLTRFWLIGYPVVYLGVSLYRTWRPMKLKRG